MGSAAAWACGLVLVASATAAPCTQEQKQCVNAASAAVDAIQVAVGNACLAIPEAFQAVAACVPNVYCDGIELSQEASACLELSATFSALAGCGKAVDCSSVTLHALAHHNESSPASYPEALDVGRFDALAPSERAQLFSVARKAELSAKAPKPIVLDDSSVVVVSGSSISRVSNTGALLWSWEPSAAKGKDGLGSQAVRMGGSVFASDSNDMSIHEWSIESGKLLRSFPLSGRVLGAPAASSSGHLFAVARGSVGEKSMLHKVPLAEDDASEAWRVQACAHSSTTQDGAEDGVVLGTNGGVLVSCARQGMLDMFDSQNGKLVWTFDAAQVWAGEFPSDTESIHSLSFPRISGAPAVEASSGRLILALNGPSQSAWAASVDQETGSLVWATRLSGNVVAGSVAMDGDGAAFAVSHNLTSFQTKVSRIELDTGKVSHFKQLEGSANASEANSAAVDGTGNVVVASGATLSFLAGADLAALGDTVALTDAARTAPVLTDSGVLFGTTRSVILAIGAPTATVSPTASPTFSTLPPTSSTLPPTPESIVKEGADGGDDGWPPSAIGTVAFFAVADVVLAGGILAVKRKNRGADKEDNFGDAAEDSRGV